MVYHLILADAEIPEYFTCEERELRDILVYFILDKYEEYDNIDIKTMIQRATAQKDIQYDKTYIWWRDGLFTCMNI